MSCLDGCSVYFSVPRPKLDRYGLIRINMSDNPVVSDGSNTAENKRCQHLGYITVTVNDALSTQDKFAVLTNKGKRSRGSSRIMSCAGMDTSVPLDLIVTPSLADSVSTTVLNTIAGVARPNTVSI